MNAQTKPQLDAAKKKEEKKYDNIKIDELQIGIWNLKLAQEPGMNIRNRWDAITIGFPLFVRLVTDIFHLSPNLFVLLILFQFWDAIQETLFLEQSNNLLKTVRHLILIS